MINDEIKSFDLPISDVCDSSFLGKGIAQHERIKLFHWVEISSSCVLHASRENQA